jgi:hypothetical protein
MKYADRKNRFTKPFVAGSKIIFTLPLGGKILSGHVILQGQVVISAGTTSGAIKGEGGPLNLIRRIIVTANPAPGSRYPGGKIVDCSARGLIRYAVTQREGKFFVEQAASVLGSGVAGTYPIYLGIPIYWADSNLRRSVSAALNADPSAYSTIQVEVDTGLLSDCFTGNDRTVDFSGLTVQWADDREQLVGDTLVRYQEDHVYLIPAAQQRAMDEAMPQDGAFESWLILAEQSSALTLSDGLVQRLMIDADNLDYDKYAQDIRQQMYNDEWIDISTVATGQYFVDFTDGLPGQSVPANTLSARFQVANVSGANLDDLLIYTRRLFSPLSPTPTTQG